MAVAANQMALCSVTLATPTFVLDVEGRVEYANEVGAALLEDAKCETEERLRQAIHGKATDCEVARLDGQGRSGFLVLFREGPAAFERRLGFVSQSWGATPREVDVLRWVVLGDSNKEIALRLKCHEGSIERHVTSLLRKSRCGNRSRLVAQFWSPR